MEQKTKLLIIIIGVTLLLIFLWWTRYQPIGDIGLAADKNPVVMNRLTGKMWVISLIGVRELRWESGLVRKPQR